MRHASHVRAVHIDKQQNTQDGPCSRILLFFFIGKVKKNTGEKTGLSKCQMLL